MTDAEWDEEKRRLERAIRTAAAGRKSSRHGLAQKLEAAKEEKRLTEALRQHKLNYFNLVHGEPQP